ncbi:1,4-dihydroxy-6-naphthoate synthase [Planctomycetaceae bacterium SH139]
MSNTKLRLGISTCPNDTFAFHAILTGHVTVPGIDLEIELLDVQELNRRLFAGEFDVAKASFHAALLLSKRYGVLPSGSALGFGVGPLLLAARQESRPRGNASLADGETPDRVLCPGQHTTAHLLYRMFFPDCGQVEQVVFSEIMPALQTGTADFGVCIHEGRFTWQAQGLDCVADLGTLWEQATGQPLALGGILCRLDLPAEKIQQVQQAIATSIEYAMANRQSALVSMRAHAQEFSDEVLFSHVDLYVNQWTQNLAARGRDSLTCLYQRAVASGAIPAQQPALQILCDSAP